MRKDRLLKLADFLETVPRKAFNICSWKWREAAKPEGRVPGECGFAGCAVGWAAHERMFRGLRFGNESAGESHREIYYRKPGSTTEEPLYGFYAAEEVFALDRPDALYLFDSPTYPAPPTPKQVAKRIRKFVESGGKVPA